MNGKNPRPELRPHSVGNSYGCPDEEGCSKNAMTAAFDLLRAAGVFTAVSAGNEGPGCSTINAPPAVELHALVVGAVNRQDQLAAFSSRGPVSVFRGHTYRKPDIVAPGVEILAAYPGKTFRALSGTSMAGPHVGGSVLLITAMCPCFTRDIDAIRALLEETALPKRPLPNSLCGDDNYDTVPNNHYGYGRLDLFKAVTKCQEVCRSRASIEAAATAAAAAAKAGEKGALTAPAKDNSLFVDEVVVKKQVKAASVAAEDTDAHTDDKIAVKTRSKRRSKSRSNSDFVKHRNNSKSSKRSSRSKAGRQPKSNIGNRVIRTLNRPMEDVFDYI